MNKIKLVSGKEVNEDGMIYWVCKNDFTICEYFFKALNNNYLEEDDKTSEVFATKKEAEEWLERQYPLIPKECFDKIKPNYYKSKSGQDVLDVIEDFELDFYVGNCLKYIVRSGKKDKETTLSDLNKAVEYLQRKIKSLEKSIK